MSSPSASQQALARQAWTLMFDFLLKTAPDRTKHLAEHGLTPNDARALETLELHQGQTMRALARVWTCDPSNATWIVDRLEKLGLAERQASSVDRRIKLVRLTVRGLETKEALRDAFYNPPPELSELDETVLAGLVEALSQVKGRAS